MFVEMVDTELDEYDEVDADCFLEAYGGVAASVLRLRPSSIFASCSSATPFLILVSFNVNSVYEMINKLAKKIIRNVATQLRYQGGVCQLLTS